MDVLTETDRNGRLRQPASCRRGKRRIWRTADPRAAEHAEITVQKIEKIVPSLEDVFVTLIETA